MLLLTVTVLDKTTPKHYFTYNLLKYSAAWYKYILCFINSFI